MTVDLERALQQPGRPLVAPAQSQVYGEQVDLIARLVANLPEHLPTPAVRVRLRIVADELQRRAAEGVDTPARPL
jgi:hypothetical protein